MIKSETKVSRKTLNEDRIAICPQFRCTYLEKVRPLKFAILGFRKYPKCSKHKIPLVFVDEFVGNFIKAVNACLFDISSLPPENLSSLIKLEAPYELKSFINGWMYCNPIGRGAQIVSQYMNGLSRSYIKLLSRKQRKDLNSKKSSKKRYGMLRLGLKKISDEYTSFLQELGEKSEKLIDLKNLIPFSNKLKNILKKWLKDQLNTIKDVNSIKVSKLNMQEGLLPVYKKEYDKILNVGTCSLLLGKSPSIVTRTISAYELFSAYHEFLKAGLCNELKKEDIRSILEDSQEFLNIDVESKLNIQEHADTKKMNQERHTIDSFEKYRRELDPIVKEKNGMIRGFKKEKGYVKVKLECNCGNIWWTRPVYIINRGTWCPKCAYEKRAESLRKYDIQFCKELAKKRGHKRTGFEGKCVAKKFESVTKNLNWECGACFHRWSATLGNVLYGGTWCPKCTESIYEEMCRKFFEALFFAKFPKAEKGALLWLLNDEGNYMELDGHNKKLKIAFERHGRQHYENADFFYEGDSAKFNKRLRDDKKKRQLCKQNDYKLIEVGFEWRDGKLHRIRFKEMEKFIRKNCREEGIIVPNKNRINWREFELNQPDKLREMEKIATSRNGRLLSKVYYNAHTKLHWYHKICGTEWWATPTQIKGNRNRKGTWCPECGGTQKKTIEDMQKLARIILHGGKCLSEEYIDSHSVLNWECGLCEQEFWRTPRNLTRSIYGGCPNCLSIKNMKRLHIDLLNYLKSSKIMRSVDNIALQFAVKYGSIAQIIKKILIKKELIEKHKNPYSDARYGYTISPKGLKILELYEILNN